MTAPTALADKRAPYADHAWAVLTSDLASNDPAQSFDDNVLALFVLSDPLVRDEIIRRAITEDRVRSITPVLADLATDAGVVAHAPADAAAAAFTILGIAAWIDGDDQDALISLILADSISPRYTLARLITDCIDAGLSVDAWTEMVKSVKPIH